ncbi:hypothetical protein U0035_11595 [Niabella yanshanensis]|uniref:Uncharacterized protein n=1 Tax=Niabella yanshanensis TaxID=577386 RepID=A0ABZ0VZD0_9BACT|nr:hypothetical protein [Niabella yanshanensis]WQD36307.1 hypothetical protein U0035_11595 [Niabella yanshanensis]
MKKHFHINLNRIAATCKGNPLKASPIGILKEFFNYATPAEHTKAFDEFCRAALKQKYGWHRGSPGNALHYAEQLELLIEAAYLLHKDRQLYRNSLTQQQAATESAEYADALHYSKTFFSQAPLRKWKKWLHVFTMAAISQQSAADEMKPVTIYTFTSLITLLLQMAAVMVKNNG